jgi:hypothetical protein
MTKTAVFELVNNDPANYGNVKGFVDVPWNCRRVKYWVDSVNTFANTMLLTDDDYIEVEYELAPPIPPVGDGSLPDPVADATTVTELFMLHNLMSCDVMDVATTLSAMTMNDGVLNMNGLKFVQDGTLLKIAMYYEGAFVFFKITRMSHRAKIITGFYDADFSTFERELYVYSPSAPYVYHGNKLYLTSDQGNVIKSCNIQSPTVILRINEFMMSGLPLLIKPRAEDRDVIIADGTNFHQISVKLVDRWYQPVILKSPMIVTIKMKPVLLDTPAFGWN